MRTSSSSFIYGHTFGLIDITCLFEWFALSFFILIVIVGKSLSKEVIIQGGAHLETCKIRKVLIPGGHSFEGRCSFEEIL